MSRNSGPEYTAPNDQRCEVLVKGQPSYSFEWMRHDHRCPKTANQMRGPKAVCHLHAKAKRVSYIDGTNSWMEKVE